MSEAPKATRTCFVVGPIGDDNSPTRGHADWLLEEIISPVFAEHFKDFEVIRSDRITLPGMIDSQMISHLLDAELVVADLSFLNPNAFYEIGLRHMAEKPIIHMFRADQIIPFDVKPYRAIPFSFEHPKQRFEAREQLKQATQAVLASDYQVENPVTRARGYAALKQHATPDMTVLLMEIESLKTRMQMAEMNRPDTYTTMLRPYLLDDQTVVTPLPLSNLTLGGLNLSGLTLRGEPARKISPKPKTPPKPKGR
jgi:hypothetical protein